MDPTISGRMSQREEEENGDEDKRWVHGLTRKFL